MARATAGPMHLGIERFGAAPAPDPRPALTGTLGVVHPEASAPVHCVLVGLQAGRVHAAVGRVLLDGPSGPRADRFSGAAVLRW